MSIQCWEMLDSMSGSVTNEQEQGEVREVRRRFLIGKCQGFNDAVAQIESFAPSYVSSDGAGIYWVRRQLDVNSVGNQYFDCTAVYQTLVPKTPQQGEGGSENPVPGSVSFDTTGGTEHRTQALEQSKWPVDAPDFKRAINVSGDTVNGLDVVAPCMRYSETWILPTSIVMDCGFIGAIYSLTATVNAQQFRCFEPGECLFMGARGQWQGDQPYATITFEFEARPNQEVDLSYELGNVLFTKEGWQHVWFLYATETDQDSLIQMPRAAYRDTVYKKESWAPLLISDTSPAQGLTPAAALQPAVPAQNGP